MERRKKVKRTMRPGCFYSLVSAAIVIVGAIILFMTPIFNVNRIDVSGNSRVSSQVIISASGIKEGTNLFAADTGRAKKNIASLQYVEKVSVKRGFPDKIKIDVKEGKVCAYIEYEKNLVGINKTGQTLCFIDKIAAEKGAPIVTGLTVTENAIGKTVKVEEKKKFDIMLKFLETFEKKGMAGEVTALDVRDSNYIVFRCRDKLKVEFGDMTHFENKFDYLVPILDSFGENPEGVVNMVSENYTHRYVSE